MNFWELYCNEIKPALCEIDIFIRTAEDDIDEEDAAGLLKLDISEVKEIMRKYGLRQVDKSTFFVIMENGSSMICRLYAREVECGSPLVYTREEIAYIYGLDLKAVETACNDLNIKEATQFTIPLLFSKIPISAVSFKG